MAYHYATYQHPQYTSVPTVPIHHTRTVTINPPTSAGVSKRGTVRAAAPAAPTSPQYTSAGVSRSATTSHRPPRAHFAPLPQGTPLRDVPVVTRSGTRSRRSNTVNGYPPPAALAADEYNPYPTRSSTVNYGSRTIGSQAPPVTYGYSTSGSRRATSAPPPHIHPTRPRRKHEEDFNVGSATSAGRLYDEPHLPAPYADFSAGGRDTARVRRAETYGDRYGSGSKAGHKGGMFGWLVGR